MRVTEIEFRWSLETLGLSHARAARLLSIKRETVIQMATGHRKVTANANLILRLMTEFGVSPDEAIKLKS